MIPKDCLNEKQSKERILSLLREAKRDGKKVRLERANGWHASGLRVLMIGDPPTWVCLGIISSEEHVEVDMDISEINAITEVEDAAQAEREAFAQGAREDAVAWETKIDEGQ
jgi:hypothetical protein